MKKRFLSLSLAIVICLGLLPAALAAEEDFRIDENGGIAIADGVTAIGDDAFEECHDLTIYGKVGSYAQTYAEEKNISFAAVDSAAQTAVALREDRIGAGYHTGFVDKNGDLWMWGRNGSGQLGNGTTDRSSTPVKVLENVAAVSCGDNHTAALLRDGSLYVWGNNGFGQVGDGSTETRITPVKVLDGVVAVSCGHTHTAAIRADGTLWTWGGNDFGELCNGNVTKSLIPMKVMEGVKSVSCGQRLTAVVKEDGTVWTWGQNHGEIIGRKVMDGAVSVSCGRIHIAAIKADGTLWTWGNNDQGQLGNGSGSGENATPKQALSGVVSVSCGFNHTGAVTTDGSLYLWGGNSGGQLGNGSTDGSAVPLKVLDGVAAVGCGVVDTIALKTDGTLWSWGNNDDGRLGFSTEEVVKQLTPKQVLGVESKAPAALIAQPSTQTVNVDGKAVEFAMYALNGGSVNYIRVRDLAALLNGTAAQFEVDWDGNVILTSKAPYTGAADKAPFTTEMAYTVYGSPTYVDGKAVNLDAIQIEYQGGGYTYYKLRDLAQALGFNVGWSGEKGIYVETDKPYDPAD